MLQSTLETNATGTNQLFDDTYQRVESDEEEGMRNLKDLWDTRKELLISRIASARGTVSDTDELVYSIGSLLHDSKIHLKSMPRVDVLLVKKIRDTVMQVQKALATEFRYRSLALADMVARTPVTSRN